MIIEGTNFRYFDQGSNAVIFVDQDAGRAIKVFKTKGYPRDFIKTTFWSEERAYQMAHRHPVLSRFVPRYHDRPKVGKILDPDGVDLTGEFFPNLSYEIDFVPRASFKKWLETPVEVRRELEALFMEVGIRHYTDASVTLTPTTTVIDFAATPPEF
jgi:hypothetical protein